MTTSGVSIKRKRKQVLSSVFPSLSIASTPPTPLATPDPNTFVPGQSFGGHVHDESPSRRQVHPNIAEERIRWSRAWHAATTFLSIPNERIVPPPDPAEVNLAQFKWFPPCPRDTQGAIFYLLTTSRQADLTTAHDDGDLIAWYGNEVHRHFQTHTKPDLQAHGAEPQDNEASLFQILELLKLAQLVYEDRLKKYLLPAISSREGPRRSMKKTVQDCTEASHIQSQFRRSLQALVAYSVPHERFFASLNDVLTREIRTVLGFHSSGHDADRQAAMSAVGDQEDQEMMDDDGVPNVGNEPMVVTEGVYRRARVQADARPEHLHQMTLESRRKIFRLFQNMEEVGLGRERGQRVFAEVMHQAMTDFIKTAYAAEWQTLSGVPQRLNRWIEDTFARLVVEVLHFLGNGDEEMTTGDQARSAHRPNPVELDDVRKWSEMSTGRLGRLRVDQLFDIVVDWSESKGAIDDLKTYITTPTTRTHLTTSFVGVLSKRLLQPGASTLQILQIYVALIRSFGKLDPKGVLLDRVARPIRRYLKDRDDTVKVIVAGLLADEEAEDGPPTSSAGDVLVELATELNQASGFMGQDGEDDGELDWDDMQWVPDPVDAGPDYKKSKGSDVVGSLISLFDSKDVFVKEFQNIMGERLLKKDFELEKEVRVLELLKLRFGEGALQACEVMLRDVRESRGIDRNIRADQQLDQRARNMVPEMHANILSRLFWPELHEDTFLVPPEIRELQEQYEMGFEKLKQSRKLTWLNALGRVIVELELEDRAVVEEVQTWQASIIYAFQNESTRSVTDLTMALQMPEALVRNGLSFWTSKLVLTEEAVPPGNETFSVMERLPAALSNSGSASHAKAPPAPTASPGMPAITSTTSVVDRIKSTYQPFIIGMLTNAGPMPAMQIGSMLRMAVAGGVAFSEAELSECLGSLVQEDLLVLDRGGRFRVK